MNLAYVKFRWEHAGTGQEEQGTGTNTRERIFPCRPRKGEDVQRRSLKLGLGQGYKTG